MSTSNVIDFMSRKNKRDYPVFAPELRMKLEHGMRGFTEKPSEAVSNVEQVICAHLISAVRGWAWRLGDRIGNRIADSVLGED